MLPEKKSYIALHPHFKAGRKTPIIDVVNSVTRDALGHIFWYGPWRRFVFRALQGCVFDAACQIDIGERLAALQEDYKAGRLAPPDPVMVEVKPDRDLDLLGLS